jgi:RHS repeat-associated protein
VPYYIYADHINTPRVITRASDNAMVWRWDHADPFGTTAPDASLAGAFAYNLRFPGQLFDAESGLHQNYFRDYDPKTGRYLTSDPIGLAGGINTYGYVEGNPLSYQDPYGLFSAKDLPSLPDPVSDAAAGFGDGLTAGITQKIRNYGGFDSVNKCSAAYRRSELAGIGYGLAVPVGRAAYIYKVSRIPRNATSAVEAVALRNGLKDYFRGRPLNTLLSGWHQPTAASLRLRKTEEEIITRAGVTNLTFDIGIIGGGIAKTAYGAVNATECTCD